MINTCYVKGMGIVHSGGAMMLRDAHSLPPQAPVVRGKVPLPAFPLERFVTKVRDLNAMGNGQKMLVCAAGLALEESGLTAEARQGCDLYMAAKIGERNDVVDAAILEGAGRASFDINQELARLRPTHFLAELPNLYAANIAMLLALKGESLTFVGEAAASAQAMIHAVEKLATKRTSSVLAGGVFNGDQSMHDEYLAGPDARSLGIFGTAACCLVLERDPVNAIASLTRTGPVTRDQLTERLISCEASLLVSHCFAAGRGWAQSLPVPVPVLDVEQLMGQLHEAAVSVQAYLAAVALRAEPAVGPRRALLLTQIGVERYETFVLEVF